MISNSRPRLPFFWIIIFLLLNFFLVCGKKSFYDNYLFLMDFIRKVLLATSAVLVPSRSYSTYGSQNSKGKQFKKFAFLPTSILFDQYTFDFEYYHRWPSWRPKFSDKRKWIAFVGWTRVRITTVARKGVRDPPPRHPTTRPGLRHKPLYVCIDRFFIYIFFFSFKNNGATAH